MGVTGLWTVLDPAGHPVPLESLENKILAIDVSIWLNQAVKGFRDASGQALPHAHVLGLFHRICKLLFYRIKPVFVFDGPAPALKRDTLFRRRQRKSRASQKSDAARAKLIDNYLRSQVVAQQLERQSQMVDRIAEKGQGEIANLLGQRSKTKEKDLFELPALTGPDETDDLDSSDSEREDILAHLDIHHHTDIHKIDVNGAKFQALPKHRQVEVLMELREKRKQSSWGKMHEMPKEAQSFSGFQMERLRHRFQMQKNLDDVGKELNDTALTIVDHKLFVGDRAGVKRQREAAKRELAGQDFLYLDGLKHGSLANPPSPSTSKKVKRCDEVRELQTDSEDEDQLSLDRAIAESLAESTNHGLSQADIMTPYESKKVGSEADRFHDDEIVILEPTGVQNSSRRGGFSFPVIKKEVELSEDETEDEPQPSTSYDAGIPNLPMQISVDPMAPVQDDLFADVFEDDSKVPMEKEEPGIEITVGIMEDSDDSSEDDLFADVFKDPKTDPTALDAILKKAEVKKDEVKVDIAKAALSESETKEELFAQISKKARKTETRDEIPAQLTQKMKNSGHLFLQIASKYAEEQEEQKGTKSPERPKIAETNDLKSLLDKERQDLVQEMHARGKESKLLVAKKSRSALEPVKEPTRLVETNVEENELLRALKVHAQEKNAYSKVLIDDQTEDDPAEKEVFGASAPGFVRSKKSNVTEIEAQNLPGLNQLENDDFGLDQSILKKIEASEDDAKNPDNVLTEDELRQIQDQLAQDQNQLIAQRGKQDRLAASVTDQMYADCQELIQLFGLPWIVSPSEAEAQCAFLDINNLTHGTITDDSDVWVFGGLNVYKNFFNQDKHCELFTANEISKHMGLSREKMILIALMTGSDYTLGIESVGPVTAMEVLAEFPGSGIEPFTHFADWWKKHHENFTLPPGSKLKEKLRRLELPPNFPNEQVVDAYFSPKVDNSLEEFSWAVPNFVEIRDYAQEKFGWPKVKIDEIIMPVIKKFNVKITQGRIDNFFQRERLTLPSKGQFQNSKRMQAAIDRVMGKELPSKKTNKPVKGESVTKTKKPSMAKPQVQDSVSPKVLEKAQKDLANATDKAPLYLKALDEARKQEAKLKAIEVFKKSQEKLRGGKKRPLEKGRQRTVLAKHNLSEDEESD
ncbi:DNA excision repair protein ERCC-5 homolog isoform X2 [Tigriopus californicus]|uniref:DNA excision repair protein ERCC-5 homolog isoform X2 n=1 Tax=Tigriopus californicus TaxID=6832 RepID=UPI0027D9EC3F|nr:DNA excision repair protein ERCC-5 homolog isoform X2 [Tigriopus californicus]